MDNPERIFRRIKKLWAERKNDEVKIISSASSGEEKLTVTM